MLPLRKTKSLRKNVIRNIQPVENILYGKDNQLKILFFPACKLS